MKSTPRFTLSFLLVMAALTAPGLTAAEIYPLGPDSKVQPGVPQGEQITYTFANSKIFPGTTRTVTIYVPRQYDPAKPACVFVNQDGVQFSAPIVFDNLIARHELPVIIGVFVTPGVVKALNPATAEDRYNRSLEYDGLGDAYARFLLEELLPDVEKQQTTDGRAIRLSHAGNDRAIGGTSSGAIAAFTAAWERPEEFSRVLSGIGTYVGLRGGNDYPTLIRKYEPKPLRVFLQDGSADQNIYGGDWWMANQEMERALVYAGYEVNHAWGTDGHSGAQLSSVFPDAIRWLWKDWPQPVKAGTLNTERLGAQILIPGENWQIVGQGLGQPQGLAAGEKGEVFFSDPAGNKTYRTGTDGTAAVFLSDAGRAIGQAVGPDGRLYSVAAGMEKIIAYDGANKATVLADGLRGHAIVVAHNGDVYVTSPPTAASNDPSTVWLIRPGVAKQQVDTGLRFGGGITLSTDQSFLYVVDHRSHWVYSYQIEADGTLLHKQAFHHLIVPDTLDKSNAYSMAVDREGRLYIATGIGIQICDQAGRVNAVLPAPVPGGRAISLCIGGEKFDTLYVSTADKVYKRKLNITGANAWDTPNKPPKPRL